MILSHQVNLEKALVPLPPRPPSVTTCVRPPPSFLSSYDVLGNTIDTPDCVSLFECKKLKVILKKKKNTKKKFTKKQTQKNIFFRPEFSTGINEYFS